MSEQDGLICAYALDGAGGGRALGWPELDAALAGDALAWIHLDHRVAASARWLTERSGLDPLAVAALLAVESRPRCEAFADGVVVNLRGINLNPGAEPEDMVAIRMWIDDRKIISVRGRRLMAIDDLRGDIDAGAGPANPGDLVVEVARRLVARMSSVLSDLDDRLDRLEDTALATKSRDVQAQLAAIRRRAIGLRRYIAPQREALARLRAQDVAWLDQLDRARLSEVADFVTRYVEDLDAARERAAVIQDELSSRLAQEMDRTMYVLAVVAAIFLPLGLITELFGVGLGGMPGADTHWAFAALCAVLAVVAAIEVLLFRRLKWI